MLFRDQLILSFIISFILISCSSENESDSMITPPSSETFGSWSPNFSNQTNNFTQTRKGSNGSTETRTINISSSTNSSSSFEKNINIDVNKDGDMLDEINITTITYTANNNLGSHQQTDYEILNDLNNYFKIGENKFSIRRVAAENYLNQGTCNGIPTFFNHDLTFYSETENEEIYIEFFNNDSEQLKSGDYKSLFSYLNPFLIDPQSTTMEFEWYIDDMSNQEKYDLYNSYLCSDSEYNLITSFEVEFQGNYYDVDLEENFNLDIDLENETYTVSMTGYIRQDSDNLASEKVELFYEGSLDFEVYDDNQPEEINDFLDPNYGQSIDDLNLNVLYDSKYHLDGRIKDEESGVGYTLSGNIINFVKNDKFYYWTSNQYGKNNNPIKVLNSDLSYQTIQSEGNLNSTVSLNNNGIFIHSNDQITQMNYDFKIVNYFDHDNNFVEEFAPANYFSANNDNINIRVDDIGNIYYLETISGKDEYGENFSNTYLIKRDISSDETIWSTYLTSKTVYSDYDLDFNLNKNQNEIIIYGTDGSTAFIKIIDSSNGSFLSDKDLYSFSQGSPQLYGFFEDDNSYLFYGPYIVTSKVEKNTYRESYFYNEQSSLPDFCVKSDRVVGVEKLGENYIFLSSNGRTTINRTGNHGTYKIEIRDSNGEKLREIDFSNNRIGKPSQFFKLSDDSFIAIGDNDAICIPRSRLIKFNFNYSSNSDKSISSKKNFFSKK